MMLIIELLKVVYEELKKQFVTMLQDPCSSKREICKPVEPKPSFEKKVELQEEVIQQSESSIVQEPVKIPEEVKEPEVPPVVVSVKRKRTKKTTKTRSK